MKIETPQQAWARLGLDLVQTEVVEDPEEDPDGDS